MLISWLRVVYATFNRLFSELIGHYREDTGSTGKLSLAKAVKCKQKMEAENAANTSKG